MCLIVTLLFLCHCHTLGRLLFVLCKSRKAMDGFKHLTNIKNTVDIKAD